MTPLPADLHTIKPLQNAYINWKREEKKVSKRKETVSTAVIAGSTEDPNGKAAENDVEDRAEEGEVAVEGDMETEEYGELEGDEEYGEEYGEEYEYIEEYAEEYGEEGEEGEEEAEEEEEEVVKKKRSADALEAIALPPKRAKRL